jgi:hypothetical protein
MSGAGSSADAVDGTSLMFDAVSTADVLPLSEQERNEEAVSQAVRRKSVVRVCSFMGTSCDN